MAINQQLPGITAVQSLPPVVKDLLTQTPAKPKYTKKKNNSNEVTTIQQFITQEFIPFENMCKSRNDRLAEEIQKLIGNMNQQFNVVISMLNKLDLNT